MPASDACPNGCSDWHARGSVHGPWAECSACGNRLVPQFQTWHSVNPFTGRTVEVVQTAEVTLESLAARADQALDEITSMRSFYGGADLTGDDIGLPYRHGGRDALNIVRRRLGLPLIPIEAATDV